MKTLVYLATPYSHPDPSVEQIRFEVVNRVAAKLMAEGEHIFSPISHTHPIALAGELPKNWEFWKEYDTAILSVCSKLIVLRQVGWEWSKGVTEEVKIAESLGIPVSYIDP